MLKCSQLFILHHVMKLGQWDLLMSSADYKVRMHDTEGGAMTVCVRTFIGDVLTLYAADAHIGLLLT